MKASRACSRVWPSLEIPASNSPNAGGNDENGAVGLRGTGDHVLDEVSVAGSVNDGDHVLGGLELPESDVDGDTTLSLGLQFVEDPCYLKDAACQP